jgi:5-methylcytosine-specific restriction endonuclease McrA
MVKDNIIVNTYLSKGRLIDKDLYCRLKKVRVCERCNQKFDEPLYIHHKVAIKHGGSNEESNLMVVCWFCHRKLDNKQKQTINNSYAMKKRYERKIRVLDKKAIALRISNSKRKLVLNRLERKEYVNKLKELI